MEVNKTTVGDLEIGDIFYIKEYSIENPNLHGAHSDLSGIDDIFIIDDFDKFYTHITVYTNGGREIDLDYDNEVYRLGHYSELLKNINKL